MPLRHLLPIPTNTTTATMTLDDYCVGKIIDNKYTSKRLLLNHRFFAFSRLFMLLINFFYFGILSEINSVSCAGGSDQIGGSRGIAATFPTPTPLAQQPSLFWKWFAGGGDSSNAKKTIETGTTNTEKDYTLNSSDVVLGGKRTTVHRGGFPLQSPLKFFEQRSGKEESTGEGVLFFVRPNGSIDSCEDDDGVIDHLYKVYQTATAEGADGSPGVSPAVVNDNAMRGQLAALFSSASPRSHDALREVVADLNMGRELLVDEKRGKTTRGELDQKEEQREEETKKNGKEQREGSKEQVKVKQKKMLKEGNINIIPLPSPSRDLEDGIRSITSKRNSTEEMADLRNEETDSPSSAPASSLFSSSVESSSSPLPKLSDMKSVKHRKLAGGARGSLPRISSYHYLTPSQARTGWTHAVVPSGGLQAPALLDIWGRPRAAPPSPHTMLSSSSLPAHH